MKPTQKSLEPHVNTWIENNLITQEQGDGILAKYPASSTSPAAMTFSIIGGMLCILGVILLVSANWQSIPREVKLGALLGLLTASTLLGTEGSRRKWHPAIPEISYLFAAVLPLIGLALVSQIFNLTGRTIPNGATAVIQEEHHPGTSRRPTKPTMGEDDRLTGSPILLANLCAVFYRDRAHVFLQLVV